MNFVVAKEGKQKLVFTEEQKDYIVEQYTSNKDVSTVTLGNEFNVSYPMIRKVLNERNIETKTLRSFRKVYELNEDFFEVIDTEEKAYWLGFLYADGVIVKNEKKVRINLARIDREHLEKFRNSISSTHPIKDTDKKTEDKIYHLNYISIASSKMHLDLCNLGCIPNKSLKLKFPYGKMSDDLIHHFIRGYFDGDGCISYTTKDTKHSNRRNYKISMIGTEEFLNGILEYLDTDLQARQEENRNYYTICLGGNRQTKKLIEYLYKDATIYLDRKYEKSLECIEYIESNPYTAWNKGLTLEEY